MTPKMMVLRWLGVIPGAILFTVVCYYFVFILVAIIYGFGWQPLADFLSGEDMQGMYFRGTWVLLVFRGLSAAVSTQAVFAIAPSHKFTAARLWFWLISLGVVIGLVVFNILLDTANVQLTFSAGYRLFLEVVGVIGGGWLSLDDLKQRQTRIIAS